MYNREMGLEVDYNFKRNKPVDYVTTTQQSVSLLLTFDDDRIGGRDLLGKSLEEVISDAEQSDTTGEFAKARKELAKMREESGCPVTLKQLRLRVGLSQAELAGKLGTSQSYVARLESQAIHNPGIARIRQLAKVFQVQIDVLQECLNAK